MPPTLSVLVPAHNAAGYIADALDSLRSQNFTDFEIIVVDDGSTDATTAIVERFAAAQPPDGLRIVLLRQANSGPSAARNAGLAVAQGRYIGFLDADDRWLPDKARRQVALLDSRPDIDLTCAWCRRIDEAGNDVQERHMPQPRIFDAATLLQENVISVGSAMVRRDAIRRAGGFDASLLGYEDLDLWLRVAALRPGNLHYLPEVLYDYRRRDGQLTRDWRRMDAAWERVLAKHRAIDPALVARFERQARANHLAFCSSMAHAAGDGVAARLFMLRAWRYAGVRFLGRPPALVMTAICLASLLPQAVQLALRETFRAARGRWHSLGPGSTPTPS